MTPRRRPEVKKKKKRRDIEFFFSDCVSASCSSRRIPFFQRQERARDRLRRARNGKNHHASLDAVPSGRVPIGLSSFLDARSLAARFFVVESGLCFPAASRALALPLFISPTSSKQTRNLNRRVDMTRAFKWITLLTLGFRTLGSAIAADAADDVDDKLPATSAFAPLPLRTAIGLCMIQRARRYAFAVRISIRRVKALSHAGKGRREATGECVARGGELCEKRERKLREFFLFFFCGEAFSTSTSKTSRFFPLADFLPFLSPSAALLLLPLLAVARRRRRRRRKRECKESVLTKTRIISKFFLLLSQP